MKLKISKETRKELKELKKMIVKNVYIPSQPTRCKLCLDVINEEMKRDLYNNFKWARYKYCSEFCYEESKPVEIKHVCSGCGDVVSPWRRIGKSGNLVSTGSYPKYCEECVVVDKNLIKTKTKTNGIYSRGIDYTIKVIS